MSIRTIEHVFFWKKNLKILFFEQMNVHLLFNVVHRCSIIVRIEQMNGNEQLNSFEYRMNTFLNVQNWTKWSSNVQIWTKLNIQFCSILFKWTFEHVQMFNYRLLYKLKEPKKLSKKCSLENIFRKKNLKKKINI